MLQCPDCKNLPSKQGLGVPSLSQTLSVHYGLGKDTTRTRNCFPFHSFTCTTNHHGRHGAQSNSTIACSTVELARYFCPRKNTSQYILAGTSASVLLVHSIDLPPLQLHNHSSRPSPIKTATLLRLWKLPSEHLKLVWRGCLKLATDMGDWGGACCVTKIKKLLRNTENYSMSSLLVWTDGIKRVLNFRCRAREIEFFHQYIRNLLH